jgi:hypothetical protein
LYEQDLDFVKDLVVLWIILNDFGIQWIFVANLQAKHGLIVDIERVQSQSNKPIVTKESTTSGPFLNILIFS